MESYESLPVDPGGSDAQCTYQFKMRFPEFRNSDLVHPGSSYQVHYEYLIVSMVVPVLVLDSESITPLKGMIKSRSAFCVPRSQFSSETESL